MAWELEVLAAVALAIVAGLAALMRMIHKVERDVDRLTHRMDNLKGVEEHIIAHGTANLLKRFRPPRRR